MKPFLALVSGFLLTFVVFASGGAVAAWFLAAEPVQPTGAGLDTAQLWSREPRRVDPAGQDLVRVPARVSQPAPSPAVQPAGLPLVTTAAADEGSVDAATTGAIEPAANEDRPPADAEMIAVHLDWCASRYRSYRADDNSYRSYSGRRRVCVSPFLEAAMTEPQPEPQARNPLIASDEDGTVPVDEAASAGMTALTDEAASAQLLGYASTDQQAVSADQVAYCFSRYRSYRPEDNTYQPYGGGPRLQCE